MPATFAFELNNKPNRMGRYTILLRITQDRKHKRTKTTVDLKKKTDFNKNAKNENWIRSSEPNSKVWNETLSNELEQAKSTYRDLKQDGKGTSENIASRLKSGQNTLSFLSFAEEYTERTLQAGDYNTYKKYNTFLTKLKFFINGKNPERIIEVKGKDLQDELSSMKKDLLFSEITLHFLNRFKTYLQKQPNLRNPELTLHPNTISKQFDQFISLYNKGCIELKEKGLKIKENPFDGFKCKTIPTNKEKLTIREIEAIKALDLEKNSLIWHCRNYFLFSYYCAGMRAGDFIQVRGTDIKSGRLEYQMGKNVKPKSIKLLPEAIEILSYYMDINKPSTTFIFPLLDNSAPYAKAITIEEKEQLPAELKKKLLQQVNSKNSLINKYLKIIADVAGISKKLTFHISRHSFANIARQKEANVYDISKALGHSSIKITETYLSSFDNKSQDKTMEKVFAESPKNELLSLLENMNPEDVKSLISQLKTK